ncbi:MAG: sugar transferase, partial [Deltaproteobacteria bacterium]|nr:sugar transferase [Deltaproteobacteria bacterium]
MYRRYGKRLLDISISATALLLLSPLLALILIAAFFNNRGHVFFIQERPGKHGKIFRIFKLKTMRDIYDAQGQPLPDEERLTNFGKFIRKFSLDELFQLINVLRGDMSLIGPRPLLVQYLPLYSARDMRRHEVRP